MGLTTVKRSGFPKPRSSQQGVNSNLQKGKPVPRDLESVFYTYLVTCKADVRWVEMV